MVTHFFVLRGSGKNLDISGIFITIPIIIFKDLQMSLILNILCILNKNNKRNCLE